jgi:hypothetical protein
VNQAPLTYAIQQVMPQAVATGLFVSLCTIQQPSGNFGATGAPDGTFTDVLTGIRCMDAPESVGNIAASEAKAVTQIASIALRHVLLDSFYSQLSPSTNWGNVGWRAVVDGVAFDILGAENDSQETQTRLKLQKVTV